MAATSSIESASVASKQWAAPGPGPWEAEGAHFPKPIPRFGREKFVAGFMAGFAESTARYGLLLSHFEIGIVNDFWYQQPAAFGAPKGAKGPPPKPILWLLTRLHPKMRARIHDSGVAFEEKRWREDLVRWDTEDKPNALAAHKRLLAVEPAALDDRALADHLADCETHLGAMIQLHHRYTITACIPTGDLLVHVSDWTGKPVGAILATLRGSTPMSNGFSSGELEALATAIRGDAVAKALLASRAEPLALLDGLRGCDGATGEAARTLLDLVWHRAVGYQISERATGEMPELIVAAIRAAASEAGVRATADDSKAKIAALREEIPAEHRARFDELLAEARTINRLRDERGLYADCWAVGIARRGLLEAGRRLIERGKLQAKEHAVDLSLGELRSLLDGKGGPSAAEIASRAEWRVTKSVSDAPAFLGGTPSGPPDVSLLPPKARRAARSVDAVLSNLFKETDRVSTAEVVRGISVNEGVYEGTARLIADASEFGRLQQGDVLVTRATAPYFNVVLPLLGALVTDRGGQLCHAAIVAREYGIPGVVGTKEATARIPDGARVRVDGRSGEVTILSRP
jgi:pyruvate,water dikinase